MKSRCLYFLSVLTTLALSGCAAPPAPNNPELPRAISSDGRDTSEFKLGEAGSFEYAISINGQCQATVVYGWPTSSLSNQNYSRAKTTFEFDLRAISSSGYQDERVPVRGTDAQASFLISFVVPQPGRTVARTLDGDDFNGGLFLDALELYVPQNEVVIAQQAVAALLQKKIACLARMGELAGRDAESYTPEEQFQLGNAYKFSRQDPRPALAYQWYEKSARGGHLFAQLTMANALRSGLDKVPRDVRAAVYWLELALDQGSPSAATMLGVIYEKGQDGRAPDLKKALAYYRRAADQGDALAMESIAEMFRYGSGVPKDMAQARTWYLKAQAAGSTTALDDLLAMEKGARN